MKRSEINRVIREAIAFFEERQFALPRWAYWSPLEWKRRAGRIAEIIECRLGWDITDFGSGDFRRVGLVNLNLRNGSPDNGSKPYSEKILLVQEAQVTPFHTHYAKREDIINRGGGNLVVELYRADDRFNFTDEPVIVRIDAIPRTVPPGGSVTLTPGESIFLEPGVFHKFYGQAGSGAVLVGQVSSVNDDEADNVFYTASPRFPDIIEDEEPQFLLVNDYARYL